MFVPARRVLLELFDGKERPAVFLDATFVISALVWWGFLWRLVAATTIFGLLVLTIATVVFGTINDLVIVSSFAGTLVIVGIPVTGRVLEKQFSGFRLAVVKRHPHLLSN